MTHQRRWIAKWHYTAYLTPYKPSWFRRFIMWVTDDTTRNRMVSGHAYIRIDRNYIYGEKHFDGVADLMWCEYTDVYGDWQIVQVRVDEIDKGGTMEKCIRFTKPVVQPDEGENVYLKLSL